MNRPKLKIRLEFWDKVMEVFGFLALLLLISLPAYYYTQLPEIIPKHFGANGVPDSFGSKKVIWILPMVGVWLYLMLSLLNNFPHLFNFPQEITTENAARLYTNATRLLRIVKVVITSFFTYICMRTINIALGKNDGLGTYALSIFLLALFGIIGWYVFKMLKTEDKEVTKKT